MKNLINLLFVTTITLSTLISCTNNAKSSENQKDTVQTNINNDTIKAEIVKEKLPLNYSKVNGNL